MASLNVQVHIPDLVYAKIMHWIRKAGIYEVSGLGSVVYDHETQIFHIKEVWLLNQVNDGASTDISAEAIAKLMFEHHKSKAEGELQFWWHSHADMDVFWSNTDRSTIKQLAQGGWFLNTVFNRKEEMLSSFYMTDPMVSFADELDTFIISSVDTKAYEKSFAKLGLKPKKGKINDIIWMLEPDVDKATQDAWDAEYVAKVKEKTYAPIKGVGVPHASTRGFGGHFPLTSIGNDNDDAEFMNLNDGVPDWSGSAKFDTLEEMDAEELEEMQSDIEATLNAFPDLTKDELIEMYESEYPFIDTIAHTFLRRRS